MKLINYSVIALILLSFASCEKELSLELPEVKATKAQVFQNFVLTGKFQLRAFYSNIPVDYVENDDTLKQETNLWPYVSTYLKDDYNIFYLNTTDVDVQQNALKMPGAGDSVLHKKYQISEDDNGVHINFLDYQYHPLQYDLYKTGDNYFILSIRWKQNATLYSRFEIVP